MKKLTQADVEIVETEVAYDGFYQMHKLTLKHQLFSGAQSQVFERELCLRKDAVGILLYDPVLQKLALVEQLRIGVIGREQSPWLLEIVAGMLDKRGEQKEDVAIREAFEEAGLEVQAIMPMLEYFCSPGGSDEFFSLYCGKVDLAGVEPAIFGLDCENEDIYLHIFSVDDAIAKLASGEINNAMTVIALQWFQLNKAKVDAAWLVSQDEQNDR